MRLLKITVASMVMMLAALGAFAQGPKQAAEVYNEAGEKIKAKNYIQAVPLLEEAIKLAESEGESELVTSAKKLIPTVYFQSGGVLIQSHKPDEAVVYFEKALKMAEEVQDMRIANNAKSWVSRSYAAMAAAAFNSKDYKSAVETFKKGYEVNPNDTDLAVNLATSYAELGEYEKANETFRGVIALEQHGGKYKAAVENARGKLAYYMMRNAGDMASSKPADAIKILTEAVEVDPDNAQAYLMLIQTGNNSKNWDKIIEYGEKAAELQTDPALKSTAYFFVGSAYDNKGDQLKAVEYYRKVTSGSEVAAAKAQIAAIQAAQQ